jgi:DHA1 family tetracycline resistance protein-like MFS transporter
MKKPSLLIIFLTVFIDLIGFGLILPLLPIYGKEFGASGFVIGSLMSVYSLMQFVFAPVWGRLSDRIGRRPVLLVSTAGASVSYAIFALAAGFHGSTALALLFGSRLFAGICGANLTVAQAYIADITPPEDRSKKMGLIGMAFGLGFIFGPVLGGLSLRYFGMTGPGWTAAAFCAANYLLALRILPESLKPGSEHAPQRPRLQQWTHTLGRPGIGLLIGVFFLATFCFACFETTIGLLIQKTFSLDLVNHPADASRIAYLIAYCGIVGALVQGGAIGRLVKKMGEPKLIGFSMIMAGVGLALLPFAFTWTGLLIALGIFSIGSSLTRPPVFGMLSILADPREQGATIGVAQSAGSLARIFGPMFAANLFFKPSLPYLFCAVLCVLTGVFATFYLSHPLAPATASAPPRPVKERVS